MSEAASTERRLREAAFRALVEHGYADLSIQDIGAEFDGSPSLLYHYFEDKDALLLSMLETFTERFIEVQVDEPVTDAARELRGLVEQILDPPEDDLELDLAPSSTPVDVAVARMYVELWSRATWDEAFRERIAEIDERMRTTIADIVAAGVEDDQFHQVDPDETAQHLLSLLQHALHVRATTGDEAAVGRIESRLNDLVEDLKRGKRGPPGDPKN